MGWQIRIADADDGTVIASPWRGTFDRSYVMPDGRRCRMLDQRTAWCRDCGGFVTADNLPPLPEISETITAMQGGLKAYLQLALARSKDGWLAGLPVEQQEQFAMTMIGSLPDWQHYREWRLIRQSPPRCLGCFSTDVGLVEEGVSEIVHPLTGRRLTVATVAHMDMAYHWTYDVEGMPLPTGDRAGRAALRAASRFG